MNSTYIQLVLFLIACSFSLPTSAQVDTFEVIPMIIKQSASPIYNPLGSSSYDLKSHQAPSLLDGVVQQLEGQPGLFIRNYGPGSAATLSVLGSSTNQTVVFWNGIPINSPTLGITDLSLLPSSLFDKQTVLYGSNSTVFGSGAIGGVLNLGTPQLWKKNRLSINVGSFGMIGGFLNQNITKNRFKSAITIQGQRGVFNYPYSIEGLDEKRYLSHNAFEQLAIQPNLEYSLTPNLTIKYSHWYQSSNKEIPPTTTQLRSAALQEDTFHRGVMSLESKNNNASYGFQVAYFDEHNDYRDSIQGVDANNRHQTTTVKPYFSKYNSHGVFYIDGLFQHFKAYTDGYTDGESENRMTFYSSYTMNKEKFRTIMGLRANIFDGRFTPLVPSVAFTYHVSKQFSLKSKVNYNYRLPTLNERFWFPGGNRDLEAEEGWSAELGLQMNQSDHWIHSVEVLGFSRWIDDWILWAPIDGGPIWGAQNLDNVWSRGLLLRSIMQWSLNQTILSLEPSYSLTLSEYRSNEPNGLYEFGEQLLYIPKQQASFRLNLGMKNVHLNTLLHFSGHFKGANSALDSYILQNVNLKWKQPIKQTAISVTFGFDNIWNEQYQLIERRPMPGRSFHLNLTYEY